MKIHILTFHNALNYGAVLQCYALYKTLAQIDYCDVLDYNIEIKSNKESLKTFLKKILIMKRLRKKRRNFKRFISENMILSKKYNSYNELCLENWDDDAFCVGSDQVWNWDFTKDDPAYMLDFAPEKCTKFSYAASVGQKLDEKHIDIIKHASLRYKGISIREMSTYKTLLDNGVICKQHIDPVFLLHKQEWESISKPIKSEQNEYVLLYVLQKAPNLIKKAEKYALENNLKIVFISTGLKKPIKAEYVVDCGPGEFLRYFSMAKIVFTNSFHGISFSIIFNKMFFFEYLQNGTKTNSRIKDLITMLNLNNRNIDEIEDYSQSIDYENINRIIKEKKTESLVYLSKCI